MERTYIVTAFWDADAQIWVAESDDVPGLATGATTLDELVDKLNTMIPELLELNSHLTGMSSGNHDTAGHEPALACSAPSSRAPQFEVRATKDHERLTLVHAFA
jgi:predicted RNase H-like HicB family nuclease